VKWGVTRTCRSPWHTWWLLYVPYRRTAVYASSPPPCHCFRQLLLQTPPSAGPSIRVTSSFHRTAQQRYITTVRNRFRLPVVTAVHSRPRPLSEAVSDNWTWATCCYVHAVEQRLLTSCVGQRTSQNAVQYCWRACSYGVSFHQQASSSFSQLARYDL